jgi:hypothetical protein
LRLRGAPWPRNQQSSQQECHGEWACAEPHNFLRRMRAARSARLNVYSYTQFQGWEGGARTLHPCGNSAGCLEARHRLRSTRNHCDKRDVLTQWPLADGGIVIAKLTGYGASSSGGLT